MEIGTVICWHKCPEGFYDLNPKDTYFIVLGYYNDGIVEATYLGRTTTNFQAFSKGGSREGNITVELLPSETPLPRKCLVDIDSDIKLKENDHLEANSSDIEELGLLCAHKLREIYYNIRKSKRIMKRSQKDILKSFETAGILIKKK
jgi:hypothetical protein